jgi:RNA polymerase sigma-70 factor (ECF subfamily)
MAAVPSTGRASHVEAPRLREADATHDLFERYAHQIHRYCAQQLGSREEAEDAVQSTFLNAFRGLRRGVVPENESAWLFRIAQNVCLSRRRSSWRRGRVESPADFELVEQLTPAPSRAGDELIGLQDALERMPANQRRAILLREWQGLSYREIAEELELSQAAVETLIFRARRSLAQGLEQPPETLRARLQRGADLGNVLAMLKSVLVGGSAAAKVAATVAVVSATTVAATAPVEHRLQPHHGTPAPAATTPAPSRPSSGGTAPATWAQHPVPGAAAPKPARTDTRNGILGGSTHLSIAKPESSSATASTLPGPAPTTPDMSPASPPAALDTQASQPTAADVGHSRGRWGPPKSMQPLSGLPVEGPPTPPVQATEPKTAGRSSSHRFGRQSTRGDSSGGHGASLSAPGRSQQDVGAGRNGGGASAGDGAANGHGDDSPVSGGGSTTTPTQPQDGGSSASTIVVAPVAPLPIGTSTASDRTGSGTNNGQSQAHVDHGRGR